MLLTTVAKLQLFHFSEETENQSNVLGLLDLRAGRSVVPAGTEGQK